MKKGIYILPNSITLCGMTCGFYAILQVVKPNGNFEHAAWAILLANIFDALDGWIARLTNSASKFGVQMDSLSDLLTFCAATSVLMYGLNFQHFEHRLYKFGWAVSLFFVLCGALRLARYNVQSDNAESRSFTGMPTPGAATILASGALVYIDLMPQLSDSGLFIFRTSFMILTLILGILMVSTIRYRAAKEILMRERKPFWWLVLFAAILFMIAIFPAQGIFACSMVYMLAGPVEHFFRHVTRTPYKTAPAPVSPPKS